MSFDPFRNKWAALALSGLVGLGAAALVGSEESGGLLDFATAHHGRSGPAALAARVEIAPSPELSSVEPETSEPDGTAGAFTPDAELVDDAEGFDTTPMIVHDGVGEDGIMLEAEGETLILPRDGQGPGS